MTIASESSNELDFPSDIPPTIPAAVHRAAELWHDVEALVDGDLRMTFGQLQHPRSAGGGRVCRVRAAAGRPGGHLGTEQRLLDRGVARRLCRRGRTRTDQHPLQGSGGSPRPQHVRRPLRADRDGLSRHRLRGCAGSALELPGAGSEDRAWRVRPAATRSASCEFLARCAKVPPDGGHRALRCTRPGRPVRHHLHLGHHRKAQGRDADPRGEHPYLHELVRGGGPHRRRPLPDRLPVLSHRRIEVRGAGLHPHRFGDGAPPGVRRRLGDGAGGRGAHHHAARARRPSSRPCWPPSSATTTPARFGSP